MSNAESRPYFARAKQELHAVEINLREGLYAAASVSNQYDIFLSPKVMGVKHFQRIKRELPLLYQNIRREGVELFRAENRRGLMNVRKKVAIGMK